MSWRLTVDGWQLDALPAPSQNLVTIGDGMQRPSAIAVRKISLQAAREHGPFRFRSNGVGERAMEVREVGNGSVSVVDAAPARF